MKTSAPRLTLADWGAATLVAAVGAALRVALLAASPGTVLEALTKWDAKYYVGIAASGYPALGPGASELEQQHYAFFPGYPLVLRLLHALTGLDYVVVGIAFNAAMTVVLAAGVIALARGAGNGVAAAVVVTCTPMSTVFHMPYTEALFGALAIWILVALIGRQWVLAGVLGCALGFVRLTAVDMVAVFAVCVLVWGRRDWRAWLGLVASAVPVIGYLAWASDRLGRSYFEIQSEYWNSAFDYGAATWRWLVEKGFHGEYLGYTLTTLAIVGVLLAVLVAVLPGLPRLPWPVWLFCAALAANVLLSDGIMHSRPRLLLPAAMLLIPLAMKTRSWGWLLVVAWAVFGAWFGAHMLVEFPYAM